MAYALVFPVENLALDLDEIGHDPQETYINGGTPYWKCWQPFMTVQKINFPGTFLTLNTLRAVIMINRNIKQSL